LDIWGKKRFYDRQREEKRGPLEKETKEMAFLAKRAGEEGSEHQNEQRIGHQNKGRHRSVQRLRSDTNRERNEIRKRGE